VTRVDRPIINGIDQYLKLAIGRLGTNSKAESIKTAITEIDEAAKLAETFNGKDLIATQVATISTLRNQAESQLDSLSFPMPAQCAGYQLRQQSAISWSLHWRD